jgi:hypothetical protein
MGVATQKEVDALFNIGGRRLTENEYIVDVEKTLQQSVKSILDRLGIDLVARLEELVPQASGRLASSIAVIGAKEKSGVWRLEIGFGDAGYTDYIDKGVKGVAGNQKNKTFYKNADGKYYQFKTYGMPPEALANLEGWAKRKNIELKATNLIENTEGKRRKKLKQITSPASRLAYYIKKYGIEGKNFKQRAVDDITPFYLTELEEVGANSLILKVSKK